MTGWLASPMTVSGVCKPSRRLVRVVVLAGWRQRSTTVLHKCTQVLATSSRTLLPLAVHLKAALELMKGVPHTHLQANVEQPKHKRVAQEAFRCTHTYHKYRHPMLHTDKVSTQLLSCGVCQLCRC